ncbi:WAPL domain-containing protein [Caerostris darwini]|uniref:WAPL domain-containing protein n=1 Tax=Caerostris darwini TaxID=1538125 RepID=A0AAV4Q9Y5_9ARAC|nr:WAPL domain-containing protein [Caerostris darwini]
METEDDQVSCNTSQLKYERKCEREFRKLLESCDQSNQTPIETSNDTKYERKCERDFRKLLESEVQRNNHVTYCKKNVLSENSKKKLKSNEKVITEDSNSNAGIFSSTVLENNLKISESSIKNVSEINLQSLCEIFSLQNCSEAGCQRIINLAVLCSEDLSSTKLSTVLDALHLLSNSHKSDVLAISHSLLLFTLTKNTLNLEQITRLEEMILKLADAVMLNSDELGNKTVGSRLTLLKREDYLSAFKLCQRLFQEKNVDIDAIDVLTLCCSSLRNLSSCKAGEQYKYTPRTLKFILGMTGKATQEIVVENLVTEEENYISRLVSSPSHMVNQCLQVLEHMLSMDPDLPCETLDHEDFSLLHCLTGLFGWCLSFLFQIDNSENNCLSIEKSLFVFHQTTLVSILKILSILSFNPDRYDSFTNIKGLMEKVMICILKTYYQSEEKRFDILVLALEIMINFSPTNKRTFVLLCLKKFQINGGEYIHSIEALLKMLINSLNKINEVKSKSLTPNLDGEDVTDAQTSEEPDMKLVLEAADEDMELSTIVSFISILLAFFMDIKVSFVDYVRERLCSEKTTEAITASKKVLQFASITGGMPPTGILLLRHAIRKLDQLYPPPTTTTTT